MTTETPNPTTHTVTLRKDAERSLNPEKVQGQMDTLLASVNTGTRKARGWHIDTARHYPQALFTTKWQPSGKQAYLLELSVTCTRERPAVDSEFQNIVNSIASRAASSRWEVAEVDDKPHETLTLSEQQANNQDVGYAPLVVPENWDSSFSHLYGLDPHISRIRKAIAAALLSNWQHRFHCALIGPPGCGKSDICHSIKAAVGEESVLEFDATSTTMAGAQKELASREELPRILLVEEIEKAPEASMSWLLSVLDLRGEIRKTTARGNVLRDARMLAIATVNDLPTFKRVNFGALESRFANKVFFQRPSRELLARILEREIASVNGNLEWITPTLDYAHEINTTDPREVISIALCGRDALLDGTFQKDMRVTREDSATPQEPAFEAFVLPE